MSARILTKLSGPDLDPNVEFTHPNVWRREVHPTWSRLTIGARDGEVPLILDLCRELQGPFIVLYVLLVSRIGHAVGRYESPEPLDREGLRAFLSLYREFLERDGRHHVWVISVARDGQIVFDNHNVLYAYGDLAAYESRLRSAGFTEGELAHPVPHAHNYHPDFDAAEDDIMSRWDWRQFPLSPSDDP